MKREPDDTMPATPGKGASACAWDVMRPPNDLPPANSGRPGSISRAAPAAFRTVSWASFGPSARRDPFSMNGN
jgi:hypothetical protein